MITHTQGDLLKANAEALVNTVNSVGVMGKGVALQFKQAFPENFKYYERACKAGKVMPGRVLVFDTRSLLNPKFIINFPTKRHWKGKSRIEDIRKGLDALVEEVRTLSIQSIAVPPLGCGNGGLEWDVVRPLIEFAFSQVPDVRVLLFSPDGAPKPEQMNVKTFKPDMTLGRALLITLLDQYLIPGYRLSLLECQKLAYFLQSAGQQLWLNYVKYKYGPYAESLNHVLQRLEGHYIRGYGDRSSKAEIYLLPGAAEEAKTFLNQWNDLEVAARLGRVEKLIEGYETPYSMELLATVHWVATRDNPEAAREVDFAVAGVHQWNERKQRLFRREHIDKAWFHLYEQGWLTLEPALQS
jgi:O-acetyl-ADP-ribose deacetylase (regulator of RNase III)